jgi:uncharacterized membrane protein
VLVAGLVKRISPPSSPEELVTVRNGVRKVDAENIKSLSTVAFGAVPFRVITPLSVVPVNVSVPLEPLVPDDPLVPAEPTPDVPLVPVAP